MRDNPEGEKLDPSEDVRRRCMLPFYSALVIGQEKTVTVLAKSGQFTADETEKDQFLRGNRRNLVQEEIVRNILSPKKREGVPNLSNDRGQRAENMGKGECCSGFGEHVRQFSTGKSSVTGDPLEA